MIKTVKHHFPGTMIVLKAVICYFFYALVREFTKNDTLLDNLIACERALPLLKTIVSKCYKKYVF